ncbi:MAG TPA: hypothetical protein VF134_02370 [Candidatus Dormibacteraeota bacterium]
MISHLPYIRRGPLPRVPVEDAPTANLRADIQTQFEGLLDAVWKAEANWRLDDRIDLAVRNS